MTKLYSLALTFPLGHSNALIIAYSIVGLSLASFPLFFLNLDKTNYFLPEQQDCW